MSELNAAGPFFSIIVPTYDRPESLKRCLQCIDELKYPKTRFEVVIVNDGGELNLERFVSPFRSRVNIQLANQENLGPSRARNNGVSLAKGTYLAFVDDDCLISPDWLAEMADEVMRYPECILGGKTLNLLENNPFAIASQLTIDLAYERYNGNAANAKFFAATNIVVPKKQFVEIGCFDEAWRFSEDREFCDRWIGRGGKLRYVETATIYHSHAIGFLGFCRRHFQYGKGAYHFQRVRKLRSSTSFSNELKYHSNPVNWLIAPFERKMKGSVILSFLLIVWQISNLMGFLWAACFESKKTESGVVGSTNYSGQLSQRH